MNKSSTLSTNNPALQALIQIISDVMNDLGERRYISVGYNRTWQKDSISIFYHGLWACSYSVVDGKATMPGSATKDYCALISASDPEFADKFKKFAWQAIGVAKHTYDPYGW